MPQSVRWFFAVLIAALLVGGPVGYASYRKAHLRNFRVVSHGVLYRSGQLSLDGLKRVINDYDIRTVITLRDAAVPGEPALDAAEEEYCQQRGIHFFRIPPRNWWAGDGSVPAEPGVRQFLAIMDESSHYPVLVHCFRGVHRSGAYSAIFRIEYERWSNAAALAEMQALGYSNLDEEWDILGYLERYQPRRPR